MLAIIIPYYKLTFFDETLQSLANQTDKRFKVYIGDDASPEDCSILLKKFKGQFDFVYNRFASNLGGISLVKQWGRCIVMTGNEEWLMILGDDDVLDLNVVKAFYEHLEEIVVVSNVVRFASCKIDDKGKEISEVYYNPIIESSTDFLFRDTRSSLSEYVFKTKCVNNIGFKEFPLAWLSDVLAVLEFSNFQKVYSINQSLVYIRTSNLNISGRHDNLEQKAKAYFYFYFYLVTEKYNSFSECQKKELMLRINKSYINNKKELALFYKISKIYLNNFLINDYLRFIKSIFLNFLKNK